MYKAITQKATQNTRLRSFLYNFLVNRYNKKGIKKTWNKAWRGIILKNLNKTVNTTLHGYPAIVNCGFSYPIVAREHRYFNNPLIQLVHQVFVNKGAPLTLIDIGAAVGDTVFLLTANLPNAFEKILCIDGDNEFYHYLKKNMQQFPFVRTVHALLSENKQAEKSLVRIHAGTASAQGTSEVQSITLDELVDQQNIDNVDVLKIDTDGFDGKILKGAKGILKSYKPAVIFEWHPILLNHTGNNIDEPFKVLLECGYSRFLFFTKFGTFSHFMHGFQKEDMQLLAELCLKGKHVDDWHYDVIALQNSSLNPLSLAECSFAKNKISPY